ncbi:cardiolipin synthase [Endozoicomonas ascidiicola]|uniref:cardiolipin synthase n=1 Tax=Endozoicomonas ascidiicola TaxID=1698521 RepID=UPI000830B646|nr:cardiolipin synthase [Endozoicomonas ascidiicola]
MEPTWFSWLFGAAYFSAIVVFAVVVIMTRRPVGVSLAWLVLLVALPVAGFVLYILFGSPRLGARRLKRMHSLYPGYAQWYHHLSRIVSVNKAASQPVSRHNAIFSLAEKSSIPLLPGNHLKLFSEYGKIIDQLLLDIENARHSLVLEFYIWEPTGRAKEVAEAVISASCRGVDCVVVLDNVGSRGFLNGLWARRFRVEGVSVTASMSVGPLGMLVERIDIRNHRKILVVDDRIAWTGSFNLVDPSLFKQDAQVGQWIDAMVRIEGVAAHVLGAIVQWDKALETGAEHPSFNREYEYPSQKDQARKGACLHVLPSGPDVDREMLHQILLTAIYESEEELLISTPYFVPDDALLTALKSAAMRGVDVQVLVPERNDSRMVHHASRSYYQELLQAGVRIQQFRGGLLHTKCVLVDRKTALFGTVNLDMRSVWLNYEVTMIIYDSVFGEAIFDVLHSYMNGAEEVNIKVWVKRPFRLKLLENTMQLLSPLL